jgi:hypothetical protein
MWELFWRPQFVHFTRILFFLNWSDPCRPAESVPMRLWRQDAWSSTSPSRRRPPWKPAACELPAPSDVRCHTRGEVLRLLGPLTACLRPPEEHAQVDFGASTRRHSVQKIDAGVNRKELLARDRSARRIAVSEGGVPAPRPRGRTGSAERGRDSAGGRRILGDRHRHTKCACSALGWHLARALRSEWPQS